MVLMDVGAVPIPAVLHRGVGLARTSAAAEERVVEEHGEALLRERAGGRRWWKEEERARACRSPPSPYL